MIELGKQTAEFELNGWMILAISGIVLFVLITVGTLYLNSRHLIEYKHLIYFVVLLSLFSVAIVWGLNKSDEYELKKEKDWKDEIVSPYIESLPVEKREAVYIKIESELTSKGRYRYTSDKTIERTPLTVTFKENGLTTKTNWMEAHMELADEDTPYVTYQYVPEKLGKGVSKGYYNLKVYLPKNYKFTDIK
ncbi:hypothetical protein [Rossellomorea marisflavi]|uniref:hypothetical protein n=1 Tax=Rossellomorea marisflavi TaxID=189381 RepID=UPI003F9F75B8